MALKKYCDANKGKRYSYMLKYIKNNPEKRRESARKAYAKKMGKTVDQLKPKRRSGEGHLKKNGYAVLSRKDHPNAFDKKGWIYEHTVVMSEYLGRPLFKGESVHHINGIKNDNRIENLELWQRCQPAGQRVEDKISWAIEFLALYGYSVTKSGNSPSKPTNSGS